MRSVAPRALGSKMHRLKVALVQCLPPSEVGAAFELAEDICRSAKDNEADLVLFPEMWSDGYAFFDPSEAGAHERWQRRAISDDSRYMRRIGELARELGIAICMTYLRKTDAAPENALILFDRFGVEILQYSKVHICSFELEGHCRAGTEFKVASLDTVAGEVMIGVMICFDREFPESARVLGLKGAEVVLVPNSCNLDEPRIAQFKSRAFENKFAMAMANYPAPKHNGSSIVVSNVFYNEEEEAQDPVIALAGREEVILFGEIDIDAVRLYRNAAIWDLRYRQPSAYSGIVAEFEPPKNDRFKPGIPKPKLTSQAIK